MRELTVAAGAVRALMDLAISKGASRTTLAERSRIDCADLEDADNRSRFLDRIGEQAGRLHVLILDLLSPGLTLSS